VRVAHVIEAMHQGGAESLVVEHVRLASPGVSSTVVALNRGGPALEAAAAAGAETIVLGKGDARLTGLLRLARLLKARRIDVVNGHNPSGAMYGTVAARLAGVPASFRTEHSIHFPGRGFRFYGPIEALLTRLVDRVICVCEASRSSHAHRFPGLEKRFITVVNGIAEPEGRPRPREETRAALGLSPDQAVALNVGSLTPQKSQDVLLRAMGAARSRAPGAVLLVAGEGRLRERLLALHAELGMDDSVRFLGPRNDVPDLMEACDAFVLSSSREGLSVTLLEAMRAGRATIATSVGGNGEAVADGETGCIVPVGDVGAMADALASLLGDAERRAAFGAAGRARWASRFTARRMVDETEALYRDALSRRGRATGEARG